MSANSCQADPSSRRFTNTPNVEAHSAPSTARGLDVNEVPNSIQLMIVSSSPCSSRARTWRAYVERSLQPLHRDHRARGHQQQDADQSKSGSRRLEGWHSLHLSQRYS
jgi:hypothetical protein